MKPVFTAMRAFLQHRWGLPTSPGEQAERDAQRQQERDLVTPARATPGAMDALVESIANGTLVMRPVSLISGSGPVSPWGLALTTWTEVVESRFRSVRVETVTDGNENFLSTVLLNGVALKSEDPDTHRLSQVARDVAGAPHRPSGLNVPLDPATARPRLRR